MNGYQLKKDLFSECPKHKVEEGNTPPGCLQLHQRKRGLHLKSRWEYFQVRLVG